MRTRSRFDVGWVAEIAEKRAAALHAEELVQRVLREAEERWQREQELKVETAQVSCNSYACSNSSFSASQV